MAKAHNLSFEAEEILRKINQFPNLIDSKAEKGEIEGILEQLEQVKKAVNSIANRPQGKRILKGQA